MKTHALKTWPMFFREVESGNKTFELRKNDRDFKAGDLVVLLEYDIETNTYSGKELHFKIGYVLEPMYFNPHVLHQDYVVFSLVAV